MNVFRPDRLYESAHIFLTQIFGPEFLAFGYNKSLESFMSAFENKNRWCPYLLVSDKGHDVSHRVEGFASERSQAFIAVAMGSSEGVQQANIAIAQGIRTGVWILIKNAHLAIAWLLALEKKLPSIATGSEFKLFITMEAHYGIPVNLIRFSRLMVFEPPSGIKQSISQTLLTIPKSVYSSPPFEKGRVFFMLSWLHSIIIERSRYSPMGWTKNYDFNDSDFEMAVRLVDAWMNYSCEGKSNISPDKIPWGALQSLLSRNVYGGKVDRIVDQNTLDAIVNWAFSPKIFDPNFELVSKRDSESSLAAPNGIKFPEFLTWANGLRDNNAPHWLGLPSKVDFLLKQKQGLIDY